MSDRTIHSRMYLVMWAFSEHGRSVVQPAEDCGTNTRGSEEAGWGV